MSGADFTQDPGAALVAAARGWIGTPYVHQASLKGAGADCLGLIRGLWREVIGAEPEAPPPYSPAWGEAGQVEILWAAALRHLQPKAPGTPPALGDVLLFRLREGALAKHLGLQSGLSPEARFIHAYSGHGVCEGALTGPWARRIVARFTFPHPGV